jgi:uncharacterized membrane protein
MNASSTADAIRDTDTCSHQHVNVGNTERWVSTLAGGSLIAFSAARNFRGLVGLAIGAGLVYRGMSGHCSLYQALGMNTAANRGEMTAVPAQQGARIDHSIQIAAPPERLYRQWRVLSNLPRFAPHLESVRESDPAHSHWVANTPAGNVEWDAEIIEDRLGELISWRSLPGSTLDSAGSVRFQSLGEADNTMLTLELKYNPPGGTLTAQVAEFLGMGMQEKVEEALARFKEEMEREQAASQGSPRQGDDTYLRSQSR